MALSRAEIEFRFGPTPVHVPEHAYEEIDSEYQRLAGIIEDSLLESREKSLALTKLEESYQFATSAVAREFV